MAFVNELTSTVLNAFLSRSFGSLQALVGFGLKVSLVPALLLVLVDLTQPNKVELFACESLVRPLPPIQRPLVPHRVPTKRQSSTTLIGEKRF